MGKELILGWWNAISTDAGTFEHCKFSLYLTALIGPYVM